MRTPDGSTAWICYSVRTRADSCEQSPRSSAMQGGSSGTTAVRLTTSRNPEQLPSPRLPQRISRASSMRRSSARFAGSSLFRDRDRLHATVANGAKTRGTERGIDSQTVDASAVESEDLEEAALLVAGPFEHDVAVVRGVRDRGQSPALLGAVAAGIPAFGQELGEAAEGVLAPVQWWPSSQTPTVGPSGTDFVTHYQHRTGHEPSYPAAQAAAAGYLAHAAHRQDLGVNDLPQWTTSTFFGDFTLDPAWRQVGHHVTTIRWQSGRMVPIAAEDGSRSPCDPTTDVRRRLRQVMRDRWSRKLR